MAGSLPSNPDDAKRLRLEMQKIARETIPELMEALRAHASEETLADILADRMGGRLGGEIVDAPAALVASGTATPPGGAPQPATGSDLAPAVNAIQAQLVLLQSSLDEIRDVAKAWAETQGLG